MGKLVGFRDAAGECWSQITWENGESVIIAIDHRGVVISESRSDGTKAEVFSESDAGIREDLEMDIVVNTPTFRRIGDGQYVLTTPLPEGMATDELRAYSRLAMENGSLKGFRVFLEKIAQQSRPGYIPPRHKCLSIFLQ